MREYRPNDDKTRPDEIPPGQLIEWDRSWIWDYEYWKRDRSEEIGELEEDVYPLH
jgi:hypothetical protein